MPEIVCGVVQPDYSNCCDGPLPAVPPPTQGPPGPVGPPGPPGPTGPPGSPGNCPVYCGPGEPEGVQTSVVAGVYLQTDRAATSHPWFAKRTGTGNTGWRGWAGLRGSATGSFEIGDNASATGVDSIAFGEDTVASGVRSEAFGKSSSATADDGKAFGSGALVSAARGIAVGAGATVGHIEAVIIGDGSSKNPNDIAFGWGHVLGRSGAAGTVYPNIVIGKAVTIASVDDPSASTQAGGHVLIGIGNTAPFDKTNWPNVVIGHTAKSAGHAVVAIGHLAESRAANTPIAGQAEGRFAVIIGYAAKGSGGCIVAVGDQSDVRGDNAAAIGTHARANDPSTAAFGPSAFAGSVASDTTGAQASAFGVSAQATAGYSQAFGSGSTVNAGRATALGPQVFISSLLEAAIGIGHGATPVYPRTLMIGGAFTDGYEPINAIHFNGSSTPAILVNPDGTIRINDVAGISTSQQLPLTVNVTLGANERIMLMDATSGVKTVTMQAAGPTPANTRVFIQKTDSSGNKVSITTQGGDTIDGAAPPFDLPSQYKYAVMKRSSATNWNVDESN